LSPVRKKITIAEWLKPDEVTTDMEFAYKQKLLEEWLERGEIESIMKVMKKVLEILVKKN
jgi:hypothetical protein